MKHKIIIPLLIGLYLGLYNGQVALWDTGSQTPVEVFPYNCSVYPKIDQQQLQEGIPIHSRNELKSLLEDFLS